MKSASSTKLAYLLISSPIPNVFIGGAMITDDRGLPQEFRYTEPLQPSKIQQILYGQVLSQFIKTEVILESLLKSLESKFKCLLVDDDSLLDYPVKGCPIVRICETNAPPLGEAGTTQNLSGSEVLLQVTKEGSPLRLTSGVKPQSTDTGGSEGGIPYDVLLDAGQQMDLCEPLRRIEKALETICQEAGILSAQRS
jgi:hypothetical protein